MQNQLYCTMYISCLNSGAWDPDPLEPQPIVFLDPDPDPRKYANPKCKISTKNWSKNLLLSKPKSELLKKEGLSPSLNGLSSFSIKITKKIIFKFFFCLVNVHDLDPDPLFPQFGSGLRIKN